MLCNTIPYFRLVASSHADMYGIIYILLNSYTFHINKYALPSALINRYHCPSALITTLVAGVNIIGGDFYFLSAFLYTVLDLCLADPQRCINIGGSVDGWALYNLCHEPHYVHQPMSVIKADQALHLSDIQDKI